MKYRKQNIKIWAVFLLLLVLAFQNCAKQNFSENSTTAPVRPELIETQLPSVDSDTDNSSKIVTETFLTKPVTGDADSDMLMVIDNSSSMNDEVEKIAANIKKFVQAVSASSLFKLAVISQATMTLQDELDLLENQFAKFAIFNIFEIIPNLSHDNYYQVDRYVWSDEPMQVAAQYATTVLNQGFFRAGVRKNFVFITDDDSAISADTFLNEVAMQIPASQMQAYAFAGIEGLSPCAANPGTQYKDLAQKTNGRIFNLCDADWAGHFAELGQRVVGSLQTQFILKNSQIAEVRKVEIDGKTLSPTEFRINNGQLEILTPLENKSSTITVVYLLP